MKIKNIVSGEYDKLLVNVSDANNLMRMNGDFEITNDNSSFTVYPGALVAALCDDKICPNADDVELYLASKAERATPQQLSLILFKADIEIEQVKDTTEHDFVRNTFTSIKLSKKALELLDKAVSDISL